jgi:hypothetical protein
VQVLEAKRTGSSWSVDPIRALVPGSYVARVRQNDASGNVGTATTHFKVTGVGKPDTVDRDGVVGDGAEAYWRLGESTGVTAADEIGVHPGTYQGSPSLGQPGVLAGDPDKATSFDGTGDTILAADQPWRNGEFTVETLVKTTQRGATWCHRVPRATTCSRGSRSTGRAECKASLGRARTSGRARARPASMTAAGTTSRCRRADGASQR